MDADLQQSAFLECAEHSSPPPAPQIGVWGGCGEQWKEGLKLIE